MQNSTPIEVIILAAGKGTRMRSELPKVLHTVCGQSLIARTITAAAGLSARGYTVSRILPVIGYGKEAVQEEIDLVRERPECSGIPFVSVDQDQQLGTGHAAQLAMKHVDSASKVLIISGDTPLIGTDTLATFIEDAGDSRLSVLSCLHPTPKGFGRMVRGEKNELRAIVEEKDCSDEQREIREINTSFYFGESALIEEGLRSLRTDNAQGELYLTDIVSYAVGRGEVVNAPITREFEAVSGANTRWELSELEKNT